RRAPRARAGAPSCAEAPGPRGEDLRLEAPVALRGEPVVDLKRRRARGEPGEVGVRVPGDGAEVSARTREPEPAAQPPLSHGGPGARRAGAAREEDGARVAGAVGLEQRELAKERVVDAVDLELGLRLLAPGERAGRDLRAEESARLLAEALEAVRGQARADGLAVAAEVAEVVPQPGHQRMERHARNAPSRSAHPVTLHAE